MMKKTLLSTLLLLSSLGVSATNLLATLQQALRRVTAIECQFVQTRHSSMLAGEAEAHGTMTYLAPDKLRWQYTTPYSYQLILNGNRIKTAFADALPTPIATPHSQSENSQLSTVNSHCEATLAKRELSTVNSQLLRQTGRLLMNSISGQILSDSKQYKTTVTATPTEYIARIEPSDKALRQLFRLITLHVRRQGTTVSRIELTEPNGDKTTIQLTDIRLNVPVSATLFNVR